MTKSARAELRAELASRIPRWYSPWLHLAFPGVTGLAVAGFALAHLHEVRPWQLAMVPLFLAFGNAVEWHAHRGLLHRRVRFLEVLYVRHTPQHHAVFVQDDMAIHDARDLKLVLLPAYGVLAIVVATSPIGAVFAFAGQPNLAALWTASVVLYVLSYEWLHLAYHLPPDGRIGRLRAVAVLRRHHATHHATHLMNRWNFNVTVPLWDWVRGTIHHDVPAPAQPAPGRVS